MSVVAGDRQLLQEVVEAFLEECPGLMEQARVAVAAGDTKQIRRTGHTLKGVMRTLGLETAALLAADLEEIGRSANLESAASVVARLESRIDEIVPEAKAFATASQTR
jgi:HPt (histidine-containing phosphotransfer) domain-containing protein